ncbi:hypothetical protein DSO57_1006172 [Entomophthora muscae]|uniref:Uncharacterized protein n=1 Tax=Entomophthora muscae TaxID=34485 RepID=A0ACC2UTE8_9FUNG|nr:hypothetical protein DSO57_1006172 [Entomophthora muscae]
MELAIEIPLATTLANTKISPEQVMKFLDERYTLDKALPLLFKGILLDKASSSKRKRGNMSYSKKIKKGIHPGLTDRGTVPFKEFLQEHISQGNPFKSTPRSQVNHTMRVHVENLKKGTILECVQFIYDTLYNTFLTIRVGQMWTTDQGFLDIGFPMEKLRDEALTIDFTYKIVHLLHKQPNT